jgi:hypothetical protein
VAANNFHHAIEMFLKGYMVRRHGHVNAALKKEFGHDLNRLWTKLRVNETEPSLASFDQVVTELDSFEELRYPQSSAGEIHFTWERHAGIPDPQPTGFHVLVVHDLDHLVIAIHRCASLNALGVSLGDEGSKWLLWNNPCAEHWAVSKPGAATYPFEKIWP